MRICSISSETATSFEVRVNAHNLDSKYRLRAVSMSIRRSTSRR